MRRLLACAVTAAAASFSLSVRAGDPASPKHVVLDYSRGPGSEACSDEAAVRDDVGARLGYAPFADAAPTTVRVHLSREGAMLRSRIEVVDALGAVTGVRELSSTSCSELESATTLTISMVIDPLGATAPAASATRSDAPPAPPSTSIAAPAAAPAPPTPLATPLASVVPRRARATAVVEGEDGGAERSTSPALRFGLSGAAALGYAPRVGYGATAALGIGLRAFSIDVEGRRDLPVTATLGRGDATTSLLLASLVPCLHRGVVLACAVASIGSIQASGGGVASPTTRAALFASVGLRGGVEWPLGASFALSLRAELAAPLVRTTLRLDGDDVWATPALAGSVGAGLLAYL